MSAQNQRAHSDTDKQLADSPRQANFQCDHAPDPGGDQDRAQLHNQLNQFMGCVCFGLHVQKITGTYTSSDAFRSARLSGL